MFSVLGPNRRKSLRPLLVVAVALWIPLAGLIGHVALKAHEANRIERENRSRDTARNIRVAIDAQLSTYIAGLNTLGRSRLLAVEHDLAAFEREARTAGEVLGGTVVLRGTWPTGEVLVNTAANRQLVTAMVQAGAFPAAMENSIAGVYETRRPALSDMFFSPLRQGPLMVVAVPVEHPGRPVMRLSLSMEPAGFARLLARVGLPQGMVATIRDGQFGVVATTDANPARQAPEHWLWLREAIGDRNDVVLNGPGSGGNAPLVAVERLQTDPRWMVTVAEPGMAEGDAALRAAALIGAAVLIALLGIGAVIWAARRESARAALEETRTLREAQDLIERLHAGLPAILFLREFTQEGLPGRLYYRAGDVEAVTGWPADALEGVFIGDFAESPARMREAQARLVRAGEGFGEWRLRQPDGGFRWLRSKARVLQRLANGGVVAVGYVLDVTAEREAQARAEAAGRLASMAEMAHGMAHELKQPLQVIALKAETAAMLVERAVQAPEVPEPVRDAATRIDAALEEITRQALRTGDLVEHLRRFARGNAEGTPNEPVNLAEALDGALMLAGHGLMKAGIAVEYDLGDPPPTVTGQLIAIEQILINLLNNARDALAERPRDTPRRIRIATSRSADGEHVTLSVADTAGGVPAHIIGRVFEPFVTTKRLEQGTGLGLAICHGLARGMNGAMAVQNGPEGAVFSLTLPAAGERDPVSATTPARSIA